MILLFSENKALRVSTNSKSIHIRLINLLLLSAWSFMASQSVQIYTSFIWNGWRYVWI